MVILLILTLHSLFIFSFKADAHSELFSFTDRQNKEILYWSRSLCDGCCCFLPWHWSQRNQQPVPDEVSANTQIYGYEVFLVVNENKTKKQTNIQKSQHMEKYNVDISVYIAWMDIHPTEDSFLRVSVRSAEPKTKCKKRILEGSAGAVVHF